MIHYTAMQSTAAALDRLCDPSAEVSAHYLISESGSILSLVSEDLRAWHAGAGRWGAVTDINSRSVGVELANPGNAPFAAAQMAALLSLLPDIMARWRIPPERVIAHSDAAPSRKIDPGARFDWRRLALGGMAVWPEPGAGSIADVPDPARFRANLVTFGYDPEQPDATLLGAFRLRFRPWACGPLDCADCMAAANLARRFPVDRGVAQA